MGTLVTSIITRRMKPKELSKKGKELAFLLRHDQEAYDSGLIDEKGWREVKDLVKEHGYTRQELEEIVSSDDKGRYEWNNDKRKLRACQGHSIPVDVELTEGVPPKVLYHGTSSRFLSSIMKTGIQKMSRQYVHLSLDKGTALKVAKRHGGSPIIIQINAEGMVKDGIKFYHSKNGYWLTEFVDYQKYGQITTNPEEGRS